MLERNPGNVRAARRQLLQRLRPIPTDVSTVQRYSTLRKPNRHKLPSLGHSQGRRHWYNRSYRTQTRCSRDRVQFAQVPNLKRGPITSDRDQHIVLLGDVAQQYRSVVATKTDRFPRPVEGMDHALRVAYYHQVVPTGSGFNLRSLQGLGHLVAVDALPQVEKVELSPLSEEGKQGVNRKLKLRIKTKTYLENGHIGVTVSVSSIEQKYVDK